MNGIMLVFWQNLANEVKHNFMHYWKILQEPLALKLCVDESQLQPNHILAQYLFIQLIHFCV